MHCKHAGHPLPSISGVLRQTRDKGTYTTRNEAEEPLLTERDSRRLEGFKIQLKIPDSGNSMIGHLNSEDNRSVSVVVRRALTI